jgi:hypothetical protein
MYLQAKIGKRKISESFAIAAMVLLLIYISDAVVGQGRQGFLPLAAAQRGLIFGVSSIVLFFVSFGIAFKEKARITTILLIAGGALIGTSVLGASSIAKGGFSGIQSSFLTVIVLGYIIMGSGIFRAFQRK